MAERGAAPTSPPGAFFSLLGLFFFLLLRYTQGSRNHDYTDPHFLSLDPFTFITFFFPWSSMFARQVVTSENKNTKKIICNQRGSNED